MEPWTFDHIHEQPKKDDPHRLARTIVAVALAWSFVLSATVGTARAGLVAGKNLARRVQRKVRE